MLFKVLFWLTSWAAFIYILWFIMNKGHKDGLKLREQTLKEVKEEYLNELREKELSK